VSTGSSPPRYDALVFALVALPRAAPEPLTYLVPEVYESLARPGVRARVPLRGRMVTGLVVATASTTDLEDGQIRPLEEILDPEPLLPPHLLDLASFIASYYRSTLGEILEAMLPAPLLRSDTEEVELTLSGATVDPATLPSRQGAILEALRDAGRLRVAAVLARSSSSSRGPLEALEERGMVRLRRVRRDRPPRVDVTAVRLAERPLEELLEACARAPSRRRAVTWLTEQARPALVSEVCAAVGCSPSVVAAMAEQGLLHRFRQPRAGRQRWRLPGDDRRHELTDEQHAVVDEVVAALGRGGYAPFVLEGVTGSGKTEVYLRCLETVLAAGRSGLVLVPEIGLTPATAAAVERRFGERVAVIHSGQAEGERWLEWRRARDGEVRVVVGPRSALFSPLPDLGLIVVDEEHDAAYKQQEAPRYHARDLALVLGRRLAIPVLLCSATPSVEAAALLERGLARPVRLTRRVAGDALPEVEVVDLRGQPPDPGEQGRTLFSPRLLETISDTLGRGEQVILLNQRRGWAPVLLCRDCGHRLECPHCSVALVVHRRLADLGCHCCGFSQPQPSRCPECGGDLLDAVGAGTEKVEHHLRRHFPGVTAVILDRDTVRRAAGLENSLGAFASGRAQVLVGTQMVAKGHHFPRVTLTGVISADALLGLPDFRAGERTFQLLTQVAGRSGRGPAGGRVVIQTYYPDNPAVRHACRHDVAAFLADELAVRRAFDFPPAVRMALIRYLAPTQRLARAAALEATERATPLPPGVRLRGPAPTPVERLRNQWRWQLIVSSPERRGLWAVLARLESMPLPTGVRRVVDVDPSSTL